MSYSASATPSVVLRIGARRLTTSAPVLHVPRLPATARPAGISNSRSSPRAHRPAMTSRCYAQVRDDREALQRGRVRRGRAAINQIGEEMMRAVGLTVDRAIFVGAGPPAPARRDPRPDRPGDRRRRRRPRQRDRRRRADRRRRRRSQRLYLAPADWTAWQKVRDAVDRPLLQPDATQAAAPQLAGLSVYRTPGPDARGPRSWRRAVRSSSPSATTRASRCPTRRCSPLTVTWRGSRPGSTARSTTSAAWPRSCRGGEGRGGEVGA